MYRKTTLFSILNLFCKTDQKKNDCKICGLWQDDKRPLNKPRTMIKLSYFREWFKSTEKNIVIWLHCFHLNWAVGLLCTKMTMMNLFVLILCKSWKILFNSHHTKKKFNIQIKTLFCLSLSLWLDIVDRTE